MIVEAGSRGEPHSDADWWARELSPGQAVDLIVYGEQMSGRTVGVRDGGIDVVIPIAEQTQPLRVSSAPGTAVIAVEGGAARVPVSCWSQGDVVRLQVVGPVELIQRRVHARRAIDVPVALTWPGGRGGSWERLIGRTEDISAGGLRIGSAAVVWPSPGVAVQLVIDLPGGSIRTNALVIGKTPDYGLRLRFVGCSPPDLARIDRYVAGGDLNE